MEQEATPATAQDHEDGLDLLLTPLEQLGDLLLDSDYNAVLQEHGEDSPVDRLYIEAGELEDETLVLQVILLNEMFDHTRDAEAEEDDPDATPEATLFHFTLVYPFAIEAEPLELLQLTALVNRLLPLGHFGVSVADRSFFLQYNLPTAGNDLDPVVMLETVGMLAYGAVEYGTVLLQAARGELTAAEYLRRLEDAGLGLPAVPPAPATGTEEDLDLED